MATRSSDINVRLRLRNARAFQREVAASAASLESMGFRGAKGLARFSAQSQRLKSFGATWTRSVTLPIALAGAASLKMFMDFDESMNKMVGLVGISRKQVSAWHEDILDLSTATGQDPTQLADAMFFITSAGLRGQKALDALTASARAADSGLGETKVIADAVTSAMNAYGPANLSAARATDILTAAVREGKFEASELAPVLGAALPIADALGVSFDEVAGSIALFAKSGTKPAKGVTQLTAIIGTFAKPTTEMEQALEKMGMSLGGVRKRIEQDGLLATLATLQTRTKAAGIDLSKVFGNKRAITGVLQLTKNLKDSKSVLEGVANSAGLSDKAFREAQKTGADKLQDALNSLKVTAIRLGAALGPTVAPMIAQLGSAIGSLGEKFSHLPPGMQKVVLLSIAFLGAIGPLVSVVGHFADGVGHLIKWADMLATSWKSGTLQTMRLNFALLRMRAAMIAQAAATRIATAAQWLLNVALTANPIGVVIVALAALAAGFVLAYKKIGWFRDGVNAVWSWIKGHWKLVFVWLTGPIGLAVLMIIKHWDKIKGAAVSLVNFVKGVFTGWLGFWSSMPGRIAAAASGMFNGLKEAFRSAVNWIVRAWNNLEFKIPGFDPPGPGPSFGGITIGTPNIPELGAGGHIAAAGRVVVGDRGPEVLDLPRAARVTPLEPHSIDLGAARGLKTLVVQIPLDSHVLAEKTIDIAEYEAALGPA